MKRTTKLRLTSTPRIKGALPPLSHTVLYCGGLVTSPITSSGLRVVLGTGLNKASFIKAKKKPDNARRVNVTFDRDPVTASSYN